MRPRHRVDRIVTMEPLRRLARTDRDPGRRAEQEAGTEQALDHGEEQRIDRLGVEQARLGEQRVDAAGGESFERVAPGGNALEHAPEIVLLELYVGGREHALDHGEAVLLEPLEHLFGVGVGGESWNRHRASLREASA